MSMSTEIRFYHLTRNTRERALPVLLEKILSLPKRVILFANDNEEATQFDVKLWNARQVIPHALEDGAHLAHQPLCIMQNEENPNQAKVLVTHSLQHPPHFRGFSDYAILFDANIPEELQAAREKWKAFSTLAEQEGEQLTLTYWQQNDAGSWEKKNV